MAAAFCLGCAVASAEAASRDEFQRWLDAYRDARPQFGPGAVLTAEDRDLLLPFVPPGYVEQLAFPEFRATIAESVDHAPADVYVRCTEKYQAQVRLAANGALENYVCGQAFLNTQLTPDVAATAGLKAAWNFEYRWQNFGPAAANMIWIWSVFGAGAHGAPDLELPPTHLRVLETPLPRNAGELFGGGGRFQRILQGAYRRVYFSHLAPREQNGGTLPGSDSARFLFKDYVAFHEPFDVRGAAFVIYKYEDPLRPEDAWGYLPSLRRVRRLSVEAKSDSVLGTEHTLEDFFSFSGRVLDWDWRFLGWKELLAVTDSRWDYTHYHGPTGMVPDDAWSLRSYAVVERVPRNPSHPYSAVVMFWDRHNYAPSYSLAWDRDGRLWKVWQWQARWSEDVKTPELRAMNRGKRVSIIQSVQVFDVRNQRGTIIATYGYGHPDVHSATEVDRLYDVNRLEELHR